MITDSQTNFVYFADTLPIKFRKEYDEITEALNRHNVSHGLIKGTRDIWCRDFMPVQVKAQEFLQFMYYPDYIDTPYLMKGRTNPDDVCGFIEKGRYHLPIVVDGGNVMKWQDCVVMTSKIFSENPWQPEELMEALRDQFGVKVIILPWDSKEIFGHVDSLCRPLPDGGVLFSEVSFFNPDIAKSAENVLDRFFPLIMQFGFGRTHNQDKLWAYMNYLQTKDVILFPKLSIPEDDEAFKQIKGMFPDYEGSIEQIDMHRIIKCGGALNCISWNIQSDDESAEDEERAD